MNDYTDFMSRNARLIVLKELAAQTDGRLNETLLRAVLDTFGHRRSQDWLRTQLSAMRELGVLTLLDAGSTRVATITRLGLDHVERRAIVEGIDRPSPEA